MWPFDAVLRAQIVHLEGERDLFKAKLADAELTIRKQGDLIHQLHAWTLTQPEPSVRLCLCPSERWGHWRDGAIAGPDGVVGDDDDDLVPGS